MLAIGYACVFLWLANGPRGSSLVRWLAPLGRCAISGYLGQTIAFTLVFYSYGLGLYGRLSPLACVALAAAVWAAEVLIARAWMARFSLGPVEWLWRSLTHLRWLPIRS